MASEDIFEDCSEEIITQLDNDYVGNLEDEIAEDDHDGKEFDVGDAAQHNEGNLDLSTSSTGKEKLPTTGGESRSSKLYQLPLGRIRNLMKLDPDLHIASNEAVFVTTRATELFIESLARESYLYTSQAKKKTIQKRDVDIAISAVDSLMFLDGAMNF